MKSRRIKLFLFFSFILLVLGSPVSAASSYEGVVLFSKPFVGKGDAFVLVSVYDLSLPSSINFSEINLSIRDVFIPDYEYLFYVNSSGAYLVYRAMAPYTSPPSQIFPIVGYYNDSWYLLLDHSAVTFNASPRRAIGLYRFNRRCLFPTTILLYNVTSAVDTWAYPLDHEKYIEFVPTEKSSVGFYFAVPKLVLNKYLGPNTTANSVTAYSLIGTKTIIILPIEGAFKNTESPEYFLIKPARFDPSTQGNYYSAVATFTGEEDLPYYGALFYSKNGNVRFVPLLKYTLATNIGHPEPIDIAPNVKSFHMPIYPEKENPGKPVSSKNHGCGESLTPLTLLALAVVLPLLAFLWMRRRKQNGPR